jgi:hypothetical protein
MAVPMQFTAANWPIKYGPREFGVASQGVNLPARIPLSPVEYSFPRITSSLSRAEAAAELATQNQNRLMEAYQRRELYGFTSLELLNLDVITERQLQPGNLTNRILPMFQRIKWLSRWNGVAPQGFVPFSTMNNWVPLPNGIAGEWSANNDLVWNAITPSLQIASRILMGSTLLPFVSLIS